MQIQICRFKLAGLGVEKHWIKGWLLQDILGGGATTTTWACHEERPGVCRKKGDGNGVTRKEKREAKEKVSGCNEGGYERSWCKRDRC